MLTRKQIKKASRLQQQVGELRPGYLKDGTSNFEGPASTKHSSCALPKSKSRGKTGGRSAKVKVLLAFQEDPNTGEIRIVQS